MSAAVVDSAPVRPSQMTGTGLLLGHRLRRERLKSTIWVAAIAVFVPYFYNVLATTTGDDVQAAVDDLAGAETMIAMFVGPVFGLDEVTLQRYFLIYFQEFLLAAGIMNILLIIRHTRFDEQSTRIELIRAGRIGRHAPLLAATWTVLIVNGALALLLCLTALSIGFPVASALLFALGVTLTGLLFAGIGAVTAQVAAHSRAAAGLAGAVLALASVIRGTGASIGNESALVWLSPMSWAPLTRILVAERWWPLILLVLVAVGLFTVAGWLSTRRDVGSGMVPARAGHPRAAVYLRSATGLATRQLRTQVFWWTLAVGLLGLAWGSLTGLMESGMAGDFLPGDITAGYIALIAVTQTHLIGVLAVLSIAHLHDEETSGRVRLALSTAVSRRRWLTGWVLVMASGLAIVTVAVAITTATAVAGSTSDHGLFGVAFGAVALRLPELWLLLAIGVLLYSIGPRLFRLTWIVFALALVISFFGDGLDLPAWVTRLSVFNYLPRLPIDELSTVPAIAMTVTAAVLSWIATIVFSRRDI